MAEAQAKDNVKPIRTNMMQMVRALGGVISRSAMQRRLTSFDGRRDYEAVFGWDRTLDPDMFAYMYNRGGLAKRVVDAKPNAIWSRPPQVWAEGDPSWDAAFSALVEKLQLWTTLHRLDRLMKQGQYAILLLGTNEAKLDTPLRNPRDINFIQPYGQINARIAQWNRSPTSAEFGMPEMYQMYPQGAGYSQVEMTPGISQVGPTRASFRVHASRVLHVCQDNLEDSVFGQPIMAPIWDYLTDLRKVVGSSSESYWLMANRGLQADVDKEMVLSDEDQAMLSDEIEEFMNGFRRFMRTKGVTIKSLENDVADPKSPFDVLVTLISGTTGIPKRILIGSEAGSLASTQDKGNWADRLEEEIGLVSQPVLLKPFIMRMIKLGFLPAPAGEVRILWPDTYRMSPLERGQTAAQTARTLANAMKAMEPTIVAYEQVETPESVGPDGQPIPGGIQEKPVYGEPLITREEARAIVGLSSDNRVLAVDPKI